jgi:cyclophilin family peptidyl-prolyl cis-trans isomerase
MIPHRNGRPGSARAFFDAHALELLEPRALLSGGAPLPDIADFEDPSNPAIRLTTRFGDIDFELFANAVPDLVTAFINGLERGLSPDQTFFHRLVPGIVLQGGLFAYPEGSPIGAIPANIPLENPVGTGRGNTERTVAIGNLIDIGSLGTSPFIINLTDNSARWDPSEVVVFARVIDDRSWSVIQTISSLEVADLTTAQGFNNIFSGSFHNVPVTAPYTPPDDENGVPGTPIDNQLLTTTYDLSIIKNIGAPDFYRYTYYEPEGFLHSTIREFIPIENPHDEPVYFEINARFEAAPGLNVLFRDDLVTRAVIAPHSRGGVTLRTGGSGIDNAVRTQDEPFALELRSTLPLYASLSHYDFGNTVAMPFAQDLSSTWYFPQATKLTDIHDFFVWYNPGSENATVTLTFITPEGVELDPVVFSTERFRRGGINLQTHEGVPEGTFSVRIDSSQPIVVTRSHYARSGPPRDRPEGYSEVGASGAPSTVGVVPLAADPGAMPADGTGPTVSVYFFNPSLADAVVDVELYRPGETTPAFTFTAALTVAAGQAGTFEQALPQGTDDTFALVYRASSAVHASYSVRRSEGTYGGAVPTIAATQHHFADGFTDPSRSAPNVLEDVLHVYNPGADASVRISIRFNDGFVLELDRTIAAGTLDRLEISRLPEVIEQATENQRYFYACEVLSDVPVVAQMLHVDVSLGSNTHLFGGGFIVSGVLAGDSRRLDDPG